MATLYPGGHRISRHIYSVQLIGPDPVLKPTMAVTPKVPAAIASMPAGPCLKTTRSGKF